MRAARAWSSGANGGVGVVGIARSPESNGASTCLFCRSPQTRQVRRLSASGRGSAEDGIQPRDLFTESRERVRATPPRGDFTDPRIGASGVDARTRESGRERGDAPRRLRIDVPASPPMNKRVDRSRSTRFGNSVSTTTANRFSGFNVEFWTEKVGLRATEPGYEPAPPNRTRAVDVPAV